MHKESEEDFNKRIDEQTDEILASIKSLALKSNAGMVLLATELVNNWLEDCLLLEMRPLSSRHRAKLFDGYGPLHSFSARIDIAYALSLFPNEVFESLRIIKDIRNEFAHAGEERHFETEEVLHLMRKFPNWKDSFDPVRFFKGRVYWCVEEMCKLSNQRAIGRAHPKPK